MSNFWRSNNTSMKRIFEAIRRLKNWVEGAAQRPGAGWTLFAIAFAESSFFPIPPDVLLIALAMLVPTKAFKYPAVCSVGSVLGGLFGYVLVHVFFVLIGRRIIEWYGIERQYASLQTLFEQNAFVRFG